MAIAYDNSTGALATSLSHTCGATTTILVGFVWQRNAVNGTTLTYNGISMTFVAGQVDTSNSSRVSVFYLLNPDIGASYTLAGSGTNVVNVACISLTGSAGNGASAGVAGTLGLTVSYTLTTTKANSMIVWAAADAWSGTATGLSAGTGTARYNQNASGGGNLALIMATQPGGSSPASETITVNADSGINREIFSVAVEIIVPTLGSKNLLLLGVG